MMQGNLKFYRFVIYLALAVSFVSGKINVTIINIVASSLSVVFRILSLGLSNKILITRKQCAADLKRNVVTVLIF